MYYINYTLFIVSVASVHTRTYVWLTFPIRQLNQNIENLALDRGVKQAVNKGVIVEESERIFSTF